MQRGARRLIHNRECGRRTALAWRALVTIATAFVAPFAIAAGAIIDGIAADTPTQSPAVTYTIDAHVFAVGTSAQSGNSCHRLRATIGEPVAGYTSNANHALSS